MSTSDTKLDLTILNYCLRDTKWMLEVSKVIKPEYFSHSTIQLLYDVILTNFKDPKIKGVLDWPAIDNYVRGKGLPEESVQRLQKAYQGAKTFTLDGEPPAEDSFRYWIDRLKERRSVFVVNEAHKELQEKLTEHADSETLKKSIEETLLELSSINQAEVFDEGDIGDDVDNMWAEYEAIESQPNVYRGVMTGYPSLDNITNGFQGSEMIIIAGMEGTGKSILMQNMGVNAWLGTNRPDSPVIADNGHNILYFTLEMPRSNRGEITSGSYLNKRIWACVSELPLEKIRKGILNPEEKKHLKDTADFIKTYREKKKFYVVDIPRGARVEDIEIKYLEIMAKNPDFPIDLVIIDYLGIMAGAESDESDWQAQGNIAAGIHEFARGYNIPVLTAVQLNRPQGGLSLDKQKYNNTRVARSAMITQNANMVMVIGCRDNEEIYPDMPLYLTKMRDGQKGAITLTKAFDKMKVYDGSPVSLDDDMGEFEDFGDDIIEFE